MEIRWWVDYAVCRGSPQEAGGVKYNKLTRAYTRGVWLTEVCIVVVQEITMTDRRHLARLSFLECRCDPTTAVRAARFTHAEHRLQPAYRYVFACNLGPVSHWELK